MAELGFRSVEEMVGSTDVLTVSERAKAHWKAKHLDLTSLLYKPEGHRTFKTPQNHRINESLDIKEILPAVQPALEQGTPVDLSFPITNINRVVGTIVGSEISKRFGEDGLPEDSMTLRFTGSAGQSFGAFVPKGMTLHLTGDSNDYVGKGLSGGKIIVRADEHTKFASAENVIAGNVAFIGATSGEAYINGRAGERFAVRNSGVNVVVEGIGDHGCEYMTGGRVVVLGDVGKNFAAGMSGGIAYVLAEDKEAFKHLCNQELIEFESVSTAADQDELKQLIVDHFRYTQSVKASCVLENWKKCVRKFVKVIPKDYKRMIHLIDEQKLAGLSEEEAVMSAFLANSSAKPKPSKQQEAANR
jgi:glutamate synthase (NADPH/NADH) large chain